MRPAVAEATRTSPDRIQVEVAYALPEQQLLLPVDLPSGATVADALEASGIRERFPELDLENAKVGIFGKLTRVDTVLKARDRVEIYRPLIADPKEVRRKRAAEGKPTRKGGAGSAETDA
jgi:putative ubiquitin-RnfH superfamily antitoxin RatB of RatAB toxin-antitoxin module